MAEKTTDGRVEIVVAAPPLVFMRKFYIQFEEVMPFARFPKGWLRDVEKVLKGIGYVKDEKDAHNLIFVHCKSKRAMYIARKRGESMFNIMPLSHKEPEGSINADDVKLIVAVHASLGMTITTPREDNELIPPEKDGTRESDELRYAVAEWVTQAQEDEKGWKKANSNKRQKK